MRQKCDICGLVHGSLCLATRRFDVVALVEKICRAKIEDRWIDEADARLQAWENWGAKVAAWDGQKLGNN